MEAAGIDKKKVDHCMEQSGGVTEDQPNTLLDKELQDQENSGIVLVPSLLVNQAVIRGFLNFETTFKAICAGFAAGSEPAICQMCANCPNERVCVQKGGHCGGNGGGMMGMGLLGGDGSNGSVSSTFFLTSMVMILLAFSLVGYVQYRRQETYMRDQIRGVVAEYMPVETQNAHVSTSLALDGDEDDDDNVHTFGAPDSALS
uniref:Vacuolar sorting receptor thioredoxin-like domain-containing protein n=1 Tax=Entomoneis paludosa TaxID=265537 RepID=A0A6U3D9H4_9STRA|mmetsp:Transcript_3881/g.8317  ORF Transcript_3881/g.8317 Transcript_3881/m.8317 type:complete len:202 (+) Transcript_3881:1-606(+)